MLRFHMGPSLAHTESPIGGEAFAAFPFEHLGGGDALDYWALLGQVAGARHWGGLSRLG